MHVSLTRIDSIRPGDCIFADFDYNDAGDFFLNPVRFAHQKVYVYTVVNVLKIPTELNKLTSQHGIIVTVECGKAHSPFPFVYQRILVG